MGFLFSSSKKDKLVAVFDIGSGSIGGAIVKMPILENKIPMILESVRTDIPYRKDFNFDIFMKDMLLTLEKTANSLYSKKIGAPDEIFCILSSPWYLSETRTIRMSKEKPFIFTKRIASDLIQKEVLSLNELYKSKYFNLESTPEVIEQLTMAVSLNGYPVEDPIGQKCNFFEMNMVISLSPALCLNKMRDTLSKIFHSTNIKFSSFTLATYIAIRDKYINEDSYLLLDVSGEITDVGIVTKGVLRSVLSFPFGRKTFFEYICTKLDIELRDAKELFKLYNEENLSDELKKKIVPLLDSIKNSWGEAFNQSIKTLPRILALPSTIFLTTDNDIKKLFADTICNDQYIKITTSVGECNVVTLDGPDFIHMCDIKGGSCDPFLMIESIAITRKITK